jgi:hypothetical protein
MAGEDTKTIEEELRKSLGKEFGEVCYHVLNEWCDLYLTWNQFKNLFCRSPERVELLSKAGAGFFYNVDRHFFSSMMLALCRLSDRPSTAGRENLTVKLFPNCMDSNNRVARMTALLDQVEKSTAFARDWRNRRISHNDFNLKLGKTEPLKTATVELVDGAIAAIHATLAYIHEEFMDTELADDVIDGSDNEMDMLIRVYLGVQQEERNQELLEMGRFEQFNFPKWLQNT